MIGFTIAANCFICSLGGRLVSIFFSSSSVRTSHCCTVGGVRELTVSPMSVRDILRELMAGKNYYMIQKECKELAKRDNSRSTDVRVVEVYHKSGVHRLNVFPALPIWHPETPTRRESNQKCRLKYTAMVYVKVKYRHLRLSRSSIYQVPGTSVQYTPSETPSPVVTGLHRHYNSPSYPYAIPFPSRV